MTHGTSCLAQRENNPTTEVYRTVHRIVDVPIAAGSANARIVIEEPFRFCQYKTDDIIVDIFSLIFLSSSMLSISSDP